MQRAAFGGPGPVPLTLADTDPSLAGQIRAVATARIGIGALCALAPGFAARRWLGPAADAPGARIVTRMMGGRDLAIGIGTLLALDHDAPVRGWLEAGALADAVDFVATACGFRHYKKSAGVMMLAAAGGGAAFQRKLVTQLP